MGDLECSFPASPGGSPLVVCVERARLDGRLPLFCPIRRGGGRAAGGRGDGLLGWESMETTHPTLLERIRDAGDQEAWRQFDRRYRDLILRYCSGRGLQLADAEDVRQVVMVNLSRSLRRFEYRRELGRFRDYLGRTVRNAIHRYRRRPRREVDLQYVEDLSALPPPATEAADDAWEEEWTLHHFRHAMQALRKSFEPRSLQVFQDLVDGDAVAEIAARHGLSADAIYKIKHRVRSRLQDEIARQLREEEFPELA